MTIPNLITSLARTDLIVFGVLVLSISASVLIPGTSYSPKTSVYASPSPMVDILSTHQVDTLNASNIASEIMPPADVASRAYPSTLLASHAIKVDSTKKQVIVT